MARYKKKRVRELQHDRFRDTAISIFDRLGNRLEGRGKQILYGLLAVILIGLAVAGGLAWTRKKSDEARRALGRAIAIANTPLASSISVTQDPGAATFSNEQERAKKAIEEFEKVSAKYGDPYQAEARYFIATNRLYVDREKGFSELKELANSNIPDVAILSRFALAQAYEADGKSDEAIQHYSWIAGQNSVIVPPETANLRVAAVYLKQGKKKEAADILFQIADASRKAKGQDGNPLPQSVAARKAAEELQKVDPDRFAQLPPVAPQSGLTF